MRRPPLIVIAVVVAAAVCAGCASSNRVGSTGSAVGSAVGLATGSAVGSAVGSPPAPSYAPSGPAASAATGTPPPVAAHAAATVDGTTVACPAGAPYGDQAPGQSAPPADVQIKAVVRCEVVERSYPGLGKWQVQLAEVADSGLAPFLTALRQPSAKRPPDLICPDYLRLSPWFALIDSTGAVLRPGLPTDKCGQVSGTAIAALDKLDFMAVDAVRTQQVASPEAVGTGCAQDWKDIVALEAAQPSNANNMPGTDPYAASPPASALVCLYAAGPVEGGLRVGTLIKGGTVTGDAATNIDWQLANPMPAEPGCTTDAGKFAVINEVGPTAYVEMDSCLRLLTPDNRLATASPKLIAQLSAAALGES